MSVYIYKKKIKEIEKKIHFHKLFFDKRSLNTIISPWVLQDLSASTAATCCSNKDCPSAKASDVAGAPTPAE